MMFLLVDFLYHLITVPPLSVVLARSTAKANFSLFAGELDIRRLGGKQCSNSFFLRNPNRKAVVDVATVQEGKVFHHRASILPIKEINSVGTRRFTH